MTKKTPLDFIPVCYHTAFKIVSIELGGFTNYNLMANEIAEEFLDCVDKKLTIEQVVEHFKKIQLGDC